MEHAIQEEESNRHSFRRQTKRGDEEVIIPDILVVGYGRTRVNQSRCLKCKSTTFTPEPFCEDCVYKAAQKYGMPKALQKMFRFAPKRNITTDQTIICRYIGFKQKTGISKRRSTKNFKWVIRRDEFTCRYCGLDMNEHINLVTVDHINPFCTGGNNDVENLATACRKCNCIGNDLIFDNFYSKREHIRKRRKQKGLTLWD